MSTEVFELNDISDPENYYPVGIFLSLADAIAAVQEQSEPWKLSESSGDNEFVKLEIRKRAIGFSGHGHPVWEKSWTYEYVASEDKTAWFEVAK